MALNFDLTEEENKQLKKGGTALPGAFEFYLKGQGYLKFTKNLEMINNAISSFQKAINQDPSFTRAATGLGESFWQKFQITKEKKWGEKAIKYCDLAISQNGNNYLAYFY